MSEVHHYIRRWRCGGGMETIVRIHFPEDGSPVNAAGDRRIELLPRDTSVWSSIRSLDKNSRIQSGNNPSVINLHYNGYGIDWNYSGNNSCNRWIFLHSDYPQLGKWLSRLRPYVTGIVCVSDTLALKVRKILPGIPENRLWTLPLPVLNPLDDVQKSPLDKHLIIGYAGRIQFAQKRLDRTAAFLRQLDVLNLDYKMEFLGTGEAEEALRRQFKSNSKVQFHGHKTGQAFRDVLRQWKYMVFFSDYEGLPLALLDGMRANVIPVYPDHYDKQGELADHFPDCLYAPGNVTDAIRVITNMESTAGGHAGRSFADRTMAFLNGHTLSAYTEKFNQWKSFAESVKSPPVESGFPGFLPVWIYHRYNRVLQTGSIFSQKTKTRNV